MFTDDYFYTQKKKHDLISRAWFVEKGEKLSSRLLIALCKTCQAKITLEGIDQQKIIRNVDGSKDQMIGTLPVWQIIEIKEDISQYYGKQVQLIVKSLANNDSPNNIWALRTIRHRKSLGL